MKFLKYVLAIWNNFPIFCCLIDFSKFNWKCIFTFFSPPPLPALVMFSFSSPLHFNKKSANHFGISIKGREPFKVRAQSWWVLEVSTALLSHHIPARGLGTPLDLAQEFSPVNYPQNSMGRMCGCCGAHTLAADATPALEGPDWPTFVRSMWQIALQRNRR